MISLVKQGIMPASRDFPWIHRGNFLRGKSERSTSPAWTSAPVVYYLFFASSNSTGEKIVKEIFDRYRNRGGR
jgi:hypothetical protein